MIVSQIPHNVSSVGKLAVSRLPNIKSLFELVTQKEVFLKTHLILEDHISFHLRQPKHSNQLIVQSIESTYS